MSRSLSQALVADFGEEASRTRKVLAQVPGDRLDFKPHEKSMSLGQLASHIAETPAWTRSMMESDLDFASAAAASYEPFVATSREELLESFEKNVAAFEKTLGEKDDAFLEAAWTMRHGEKVLLSLPRHAALRMTAIHHVVHHRGQLTVYLRLLGVAVPSTYGPTADHPDLF